MEPALERATRRDELVRQLTVGERPEVAVGDGVGAGLDAATLELEQLEPGEERRAPVCAAIRDHVRRRAHPKPLQHRERVPRQVVIAVVEGDQHGLRRQLLPESEPFVQLSLRDRAEPVAVEPEHLPLEGAGDPRSSGALSHAPVTPMRWYIRIGTPTAREVDGVAASAEGAPAVPARAAIPAARPQKVAMRVLVATGAEWS